MYYRYRLHSRCPAHSVPLDRLVTDHYAPFCVFARGAAAAIIVYDVTSADSFTRAKNWVKELQHTGNANMIMAVAGAKTVDRNFVLYRFGCSRLQGSLR